MSKSKSKNMKQLLVFLLAIGLFACNQKSDKNSVIKMTAEELKAKHGIVLPDIEYNGDEIATSNGKGGAKQKSTSVNVSVSEGDLIISGSVSCTTSSNAEWGGIQKFLALPLSNDGAVSYCNFNWSNTTAPSLMNCPTTTSGVYRGWTSDHNYDIHLSNTITIP